jgi:hypothetical protein
MSVLSLWNGLASTRDLCHTGLMRAEQPPQDLKETSWITVAETMPRRKSAAPRMNCGLSFGMPLRTFLPRRARRWKRKSASRTAWWKTLMTARRDAGCCSSGPRNLTRTMRAPMTTTLPRNSLGFLLSVREARPSFAMRLIRPYPLRGLRTRASR